MWVTLKTLVTYKANPISGQDQQICLNMSTQNSVHEQHAQLHGRLYTRQSLDTCLHLLQFHVGGTNCLVLPEQGRPSLPSRSF